MKERCESSRAQGESLNEVEELSVTITETNCETLSSKKCVAAAHVFPVSCVIVSTATLVRVVDTRPSKAPKLLQRCCFLWFLRFFVPL